jgi:hypothetical protein
MLVTGSTHCMVQSGFRLWPLAHIVAENTCVFFVHKPEWQQ